MVSDTAKTEARRRRKQGAQGKARKRAQEREGSTPKFPIHPEGEKKPSAKKPSSK